MHISFHIDHFKKIVNKKIKIKMAKEYNEETNNKKETKIKNQNKKKR